MIGENLKRRKKGGRKRERERTRTVLFRYTDIAKGDKEGLRIVTN